MSVLAFFPIMTVHPGFRVDCLHLHQTPDQQLMHCCFHKSKKLLGSVHSSAMGCHLKAADKHQLAGLSEL